MERLWDLKNKKYFEEAMIEIIAVYKNPEDLNLWLRLDTTFICMLLKTKKLSRSWKGVRAACNVVQKLRNKHAHICTQTIQEGKLPKIEILFKRAKSLLQLLWYEMDFSSSDFFPFWFLAGLVFSSVLVY